jgi:ribosomal protein S18 acetylase RimI-like enzyme
MSEQQYAIIEGLHDARSLVYATWLRCYQSSSPMARHLHKDTFFREHHQVIDRILARPSTEVRLAVLPDDPSVVFGWSVHEPGLIHFVYVKPSFRRYGIAKSLLAGLPSEGEYTHFTYVLKDLEPKLAGYKFNPYRA